MKGIINRSNVTSKQLYKERIEEHHYLKRKLLQIFWNERDYMGAGAGGQGGGKKNTISD